jgi:hypothetical protein
MKKHTITITFFALFLFPVITSAADSDWNSFSGVYEMSASGSCIHSQNNFTVGSNGWYLANPGVIYAGTTAWTGTWTFNKGGTGTYSYVMYATVTPPVQQPDPAIAGGVRIFSANEKTLTYEITPFGDITVHTQEGDTLYGSISIDKKSITLFDALRVKGPGTNPWYYIVCTATRTLIKVSN